MIHTESMVTFTALVKFNARGARSDKDFCQGFCYTVCPVEGYRLSPRGMTKSLIHGYMIAQGLY